MGEFTKGFMDSPEGQIAKDKQVDVSNDQIDIPNMDGLKCNGIHRIDGHPIFNVDHNSFYQNTSNGRQRLRFKSGSDVQKFMQNGKYKQPFYLRHSKNGYMRKVK